MVEQVSTPLSPKVTAGALAGALTTVVVAVAALLGFELPAGVGESVGVLLGAVVVSVVAWAKRDPLRDAGQAVLDAPLEPPASSGPETLYSSGG